jgi:hypothetical protein
MPISLLRTSLLALKISLLKPTDSDLFPFFYQTAAERNGEVSQIVDVCKGVRLAAV